MSKRFMGSKAKVNVAVAFDEPSLALLKSTRALAERTGMGVRLVHSVPPFTGGMPSRLAGYLDPLAAIAQAVDENCVLEAGSRLREMAQMFKDASKVETSVTCGPIASSLIADAIVHRASLIMTGAGDKTYRFVPQGFSTALSLMGESPVPVMTIGAACSVDLSKKDLRLLIADDLSLQSAEAVLAGFDLARALGSTRVLHLHVNTLTPERLEKALIGVRQKAQTAACGAYDPGEIFKNSREELEREIRRRSPERVPLLEARGGFYETQVVTGDAATEIERMADKFGADLVVYGRHVTFRRKPFAIGKVPFHEMLAQKRIVVVAAPRA